MAGSTVSSFCRLYGAQEISQRRCHSNFFAVDGALGGSIAIWTFAGVFGFFTLLSLIGSFFFNHRCRKKPYGGKTGIRKWIGPRCIYLLMTFCIVVSFIAAMAHGPGLENGLSSGLIYTRVVRDRFERSGTAVKSVIRFYEIPNVAYHVRMAREAAEDGNIINQLTSIESRTEELKQDANSFQSSLDGLIEVFYHNFSNGNLGNNRQKFYLEGANYILTNGLYVVGGFAIVWLLLHSLGLRANKRSATFFRATSFITLIVAILAMTMCAFTLAVAVVGSDFCDTPDRSLAHVMSMVHTDPIVRDSLPYYVTCYTYYGSKGVAGQLEDVDYSTGNIRDAIVNALDDATTLGESTTVITQLTNAKDSILIIASTLRDINDEVGCDQLQPYVVRALDNLCNQWIVNDIRIAMALGAICIFFIPLFFVTVSLSYRHPGHPIAAPRAIGETVVKNPQYVVTGDIPLLSVQK